MSTGIGQPPVADAGQDQTVDANQLITLGNPDVAQKGVTYAWKQVGGEHNVDLAGSGTATPSFMAPELITDTVFSFELTVTDSQGVKSTDTVGVLVKFYVVQAMPTGKLNDSGVTKCETYSGDSIDCSRQVGVDGSPIIPGQDGASGRDFTHYDDSDGYAGFSFTKIGANGAILAIQDRLWDDNGSEAEGTRWACVKDNVTGLVWEVKQGSPSYVGYGTDKGLQHPDRRFYFSEGDKYVEYMNEARWCGANDWRKPTAAELVSITNYGDNCPLSAIDLLRGDYEERWMYPSSDWQLFDDKDETKPIGGYTLFFSCGEARGISHTIPLALQLVRSGGSDTYQLQCKLTFHDSTVTNHTTGLTWKRCLEGQDFDDNGTPDNYLDDKCISQKNVVEPKNYPLFNEYGSFKNGEYSEDGRSLIYRHEFTEVEDRCPDKTWHFSDSGTPGFYLDDQCWKLTVAASKLREAILLADSANINGGYGGYSDWRLPNGKEFYSALNGCEDHSVFNNEVVFPDNIGGAWASSETIWRRHNLDAFERGEYLRLVRDAQQGKCPFRQVG